MLGTFALWFGWYGFNPGSTLSMHDKEMGALAAQVAMRGYENTSSTSTCTVAPGPAALDTGQQAANVLPGDPFREAEFQETGGGKSRVRVRWRLGHVGISSFAAGLLSALEVCHDWKRGARLGEADHPGPSGGGARATARRRAEAEEENEGSAEGMGDLAGMLRPIIEKLIRQVLKEILGGSAMKQMVAGMLAGEQPAVRRSSTASSPDDDEAMDEDYRKVARWKKRRRMEEDGQQKGKGKGDGNGPSKGAKGDGQPKGKGQNAGETAPGKGKNAGETALGKGKECWVVRPRRARA